MNPSVSQPVSESVPSPYGPFAHDSASHAAHIAWQLCDQVQRHEAIAQAAYFRARHRGFEPGHELEDWLAAEGEVDSELAIGPRL